MGKKSKSGVLPKLRFSEFRETERWRPRPLSELLDYLQPTPYLVADTNYSSQFKTPVLTAGKTFILGYTNEQHGIFSDGLPVIIFDDFTTASKLVGFPFKAKSSAMKILQASTEANIRFMYEILQIISFEIGAHERHWISRFAPMLVAIPELGEQQKIADCLTSLDEVIDAQKKKVEALKTYKRGLSQQLFPQEGETQPRLRLAASASKKAWRRQKISLVLEKLAEPVSVKPDEMYREIGIRSHGKGIFHKEATSGEQIGDKRVFHVVQDALVLNIVFAWEQAVATTSKNEIGMIASHRFPMYVAKSKQCDVRLLREFFLTKAGKYLLWLASPGGAGRNKTLGQKEFENLEISLPVDVKEQSRIADCLASADQDVVTENAKLLALKAHKKGLMQQLFPSSAKD